MQQLYLELRFHVDAVVVLRGLAIDVLLPVLAHHDDWRGLGCLERKREIEKNSQPLTRRPGWPLRMRPPSAQDGISLHVNPIGGVWRGRGTPDVLSTFCLHHPSADKLAVAS